MPQGQGPKTYAGRKHSTTEHHFRGKEVLDIHLLKAERHEAVALGPGGVPVLVADDDETAAPQWVSYEYRTAHPILRWLPSKLAQWLGENMEHELAIPAKQGDKYTVAQLNSILMNNLVPNRDGGHLRTFTHLQWECEDYRGLPKARCYPFDLDGHRFRGKNPQVFVTCHLTCYISYNRYHDSMLYTMLAIYHIACYILCYIPCFIGCIYDVT